MTEGMNVKKEVIAFIGIVFLLLGVLFGMQIMTFIFGNLGTTTSSLDAASNTVINESGAITNGTGYTLDGASDPGFANVAITLIVNTTDGITITAENYTVSTIGVLTNATAQNWSSVEISYTYNLDSVAKITSDSVVNNSLGSIETYTNQSDIMAILSTSDNASLVICDSFI